MIIYHRKLIYPDLFRLSIPRFAPLPFLFLTPFCFSLLSNPSVLGFDYSASVFPFLLFLVPPHSCFPSARLRSRFLGFPFLPGPISRAFLPGSRTRLPVCFLSSFLASLRSHSCSTSACLLLSPSAFSLSFRFLSSQIGRAHV